MVEVTCSHVTCIALLLRAHTVLFRSKRDGHSALDSRKPLGLLAGLQLHFSSLWDQHISYEVH